MDSVITQTTMPTDASFALCLSHDIDRVHKSYQYLYEALVERQPSEVLKSISGDNPYWSFPRLMDIESEFGVRSSIHILDEMPLSDRPKSDWFSKRGWQLFGGRSDIEDEQMASILRVLDRFGWEIALHGSYTSSENPERFTYEKERIESIIESDVIGNRQHYWRLDRPDTWRHLRDAGIKYDTSLGSSTEIEFQHGYELIRPFDDEFVVFPWSLMDGALMQAGDTFEECLLNAEELLETTRDHRSVLVLNWHGGPVFNEDERPGWSEMYKRIIERAIEMGAWVGPPGRFYESIEHPEGTIDTTLRALSA